MTAIRFQKIVLREIRMPLVEPFEISSGRTTERRILLLESTDFDGVTVWSECTAGEKPNYYPDTVDTSWLVLTKFIVPAILNQVFSHPREIKPFLDRKVRGHSMAKAAVEMAGWGLLAEKQGRSLASILGGTQHRIPVGISIGIQDSPEALVKKVRESAQMGYQKMKIKIKPDRDRDYLKMVRKELGDAVPIMADANNAYALADVHRLKELDGFHLMMIEQPLAWDDLLDHSELQKQLKTPVCLDESISGIGKAREMVKLASGRIVNIKPGRVGGLAESVAIHDFCQANRIPVWCGGMLESGIGRAYNVALASLHNFVFPGDISPSKRYWAQDVVSPAWDMDAHGRIAVPFEKRGLGVEIDTRRIESLTAEKIELK